MKTATSPSRFPRAGACSAIPQAPANPLEEKGESVIVIELWTAVAVLIALIFFSTLTGYFWRMHHETRERREVSLMAEKKHELKAWKALLWEE